jgi:flagellar biosynthesis/type III secretory pathway protein FliH
MGRVVKSFGHVIPKETLDARAEADELIAGARAEADAIRGQAEAVRESARRDGLEVGRAEGLAEALLTLTAARLEAARMVDTSRPAAIALASKMTEKIVGRAVTLAPEVMADIVGEPHGRVDARLESQLAALERALRGGARGG